MSTTTSNEVALAEKFGAEAFTPAEAASELGWSPQKMGGVLNALARKGLAEQTHLGWVLKVEVNVHTDAAPVENPPAEGSPVLLGARRVLILVTALFGVFTASEWFLSLNDVDIRLALFVSGLFGASALVTPYVVPALTQARGWALAALLVVAAVFMTVDSLGLDRGLNNLEERMTSADFEAAVKAVEEARQPHLDSVAEAERKRDEVELLTTLPSGEPLGPQRMEQARLTYQSQRAAHQAVADEARARAKAVADPVRGDIWSGSLIMVLSWLIQLALAAGFAAIEATRRRAA